MIVAPSFLTADFSKLDSEIQSIASSPWLHFDVMDGLFVPAITYGPEMVARLQPVSTQVFDVHLMVVEPELCWEDYAQAGADLITIHFESVRAPLLEVIQTMKNKGVRVGLSVKPATPITVLEPYLPWIDLVLVMSVEPGKGGQPFLPSALEKIKWLYAERSRQHLQFLIEVDGGINASTVHLVKAAGADVIVVGSYLFNQTNRSAIIGELEHV
ncbi:MAG: ribulose-phosphate 3-epimerase [Bacillus subtilis]|nr:ribulose-phosphate 3-epimerase [Bacillus subtilis]